MGDIGLAEVFLTVFVTATGKLIEKGLYLKDHSICRYIFYGSAQEHSGAVCQEKCRKILCLRSFDKTDNRRFVPNKMIPLF